MPMFNPNEPIAEQLVVNAEDLRPRVMTPTVTQPNPTTNLGGAMSTEFPSFGSDLSSGVQSFLTRMGSGTRADDYEDMRKASLQAAQLGIEGGIIHASGLAGGMLGQGLGKALGFNTPRETKKARIDEMMAQYPDPQTYEDYMAIAAGAKDIGELDLWEKAFNMAQDMKTTKTTANLDLQKLHDSLAYLESVSGITLNPLQRKHWLARVKKTVSVGEWGSVDTGKTVFNSILSDMKLKGQENDFEFQDLQSTGSADINKKEALDKKVKSLSTDLIKATN
ncbi:MAG: hypothetical protein NZ811_05095, partial [Gammaproteobacteria bacterium]|nr:hypothetical protein [Gammaproteobacteria bacterium]